MNNLIADTYVILWKHFERQRSNDEDFLASGVFGLTVMLAVANLLQLIFLAFGLRAPVASGEDSTVK